MFKQYVVQTQWACEQFNSLDLARRYAEQARWAAIHKGCDVIAIEGASITLHADRDHAKFRAW